MRGKPGSFLAMLARRLTKIEIHGQENLAVLEKPGPAMIVVNHTTVVDVVVVVGTLHKLGFTVDMWNFPLAKQIVTGSGIIPTDQHDGRSAYRAARAALKNNEVVLMYPEGDVKINPQASPRAWRPGTAGLAKSVSMPVLPIAHHDTRKLGSGSVERSILQALSKIFRRPRIHLMIGTPVPASALAALDPKQINDYLERELTSLWQRVSSLT